MRSIKWFLMMLMVLILALPASAQDNEITFVGDDPTKMQQMLGWLAGGYGGPQVLGITVYIGELPTDLGFELPQIAGADLIGAIERPQGYGPPGTEFTEIFLLATESPQTITTAYADVLTAAGWVNVDENRPAGGFEVMQNSYVSLCQNEAAHSVTIEAFVRGTETYVVVRVMTPG